MEASTRNFHTRAYSCTNTSSGKPQSRVCYHRIPIAQQARSKFLLTPLPTYTSSSEPPIQPHPQPAYGPRHIDTQTPYTSLSTVEAAHKPTVGPDSTAPQHRHILSTHTTPRCHHRRAAAPCAPSHTAFARHCWIHRRRRSSCQSTFLLLRRLRNMDPHSLHRGCPFSGTPSVESRTAYPTSLFSHRYWR